MDAWDKVDFHTYYSDSEDNEIEDKRDINSYEDIFVSDFEDNIWNLSQDMSVNISDLKGDSNDSVCETPQNVRIKKRDFSKVKRSEKGH